MSAYLVTIAVIVGFGIMVSSIFHWVVFAVAQHPHDSRMDPLLIGHPRPSAFAALLEFCGLIQRFVDFFFGGFNFQGFIILMRFENDMARPLNGTA